MWTGKKKKKKKKKRRRKQNKTKVNTSWSAASLSPMSLADLACQSIPPSTPVMCNPVFKSVQILSVKKKIRPESPATWSYPQSRKCEDSTSPTPRCNYKCRGNSNNNKRGTSKGSGNSGSSCSHAAEFSSSYNSTNSTVVTTVLIQ